jgi:hypothetical protein
MLQTEPYSMQRAKESTELILPSEVKKAQNPEDPSNF